MADAIMNAISFVGMLTLPALAILIIMGRNSLNKCKEFNKRLKHENKLLRKLTGEENENA